MKKWFMSAPIWQSWFSCQWINIAGYERGCTVKYTLCYNMHFNASQSFPISLNWFSPFMGIFTFIKSFFSLSLKVCITSWVKFLHLICQLYLRNLRKQNPWDGKWTSESLRDWVNHWAREWVNLWVNLSFNIFLIFFALLACWNASYGFIHCKSYIAA